MSIEIKEGRYYRDRSGRVHGPMQARKSFCWPWTTPKQQVIWTAFGLACTYVIGSESQNDLIEEVRIVPVKGEGGDL